MRKRENSELDAWEESTVWRGWGKRHRKHGYSLLWGSWLGRPIFRTSKTSPGAGGREEAVTQGWSASRPEPCPPVALLFWLQSPDHCWLSGGPWLSPQGSACGGGRALGRDVSPAPFLTV